MINSRQVVASLAFLFPCLCAARAIPTCDISHPPSAQIEVLGGTKINAEGVDLGPYLQRVVRDIRKNWYSLIPPEATAPVNTSGCVAIEFHILKDGTVANMQYQSSSGYGPLDRAAWAGIVTSAPFWPLPIRFKADHLELRFNFLYNPPPEALRDQATQAAPYGGPGNELRFETASLSGSESAPSAGTRTVPPTPINLSEAGEVVTGRLVRRVDPKLPRKLRKQKVQGRVVLQVTIEGNGSVSSQSVISGDASLARPVQTAVRQWKFEPYTQNGHPVKVKQNLTFNFVRGKKFGESDPELPPPSLAGSQLTAPQDGTPAAGVFRVGDGVTAPRAIYAPNAASNKKERTAENPGVCVLGLVVGADGKPRDIRVVRPLAKESDKRAVEIVRKWKFEPATKDGVPVAVLINVEIPFGEVPFGQ